MRNLRVKVIVLAITFSCINNSDSESIKETNLQINSNDGLKSGEKTVATIKGHAGDNVKMIGDNITGQKMGTPNILGHETAGKGTPNLTARRSKRNKPRERKRKLLSGYKKVANKKQSPKLVRKRKRRTCRPKPSKQNKQNKKNRIKPPNLIKAAKAYIHQDANQISYKLNKEPRSSESGDEELESSGPLFSSFRTLQILSEIKKRLYPRIKEPSLRGSSLKKQ